MRNNIILNPAGHWELPIKVKSRGTGARLLICLINTPKESPSMVHKSDAIGKDQQAI